VIFDGGTGSFPTIVKPTPKPKPDPEDDKTKDDTEKDTETKDNASFIASTCLTIGAMTAMLAF